MARLEMSTKDIGHFHHRENMPQLYKASSDKIEFSEFFKKARAAAEEEAKNSNKSVEKKEKDVEKYGNMIGVVGQAGIGKTTLTKMLVKEVLNAADNFGFEYVFYLSFRHLNSVNKKINLLQFLMPNNSGFCDNENSDLVADLLEKLNQNEKVLIVMDGFDEASKKVMNQHDLLPGVDVTDEKDVQTFIQHIFCGHILPKAKKLITSRPPQLLDLPEFFKPRFIINVLGINRKSQEQICEDIVNGQTDLKQKILDFLKANPDLSSYCYIPVNCILIMHCIKTSIQKMEKKPGLTMYSLTTILVAALRMFVVDANLLKDKVFQIQKLCKLAYDGFKEDRYDFEEQHLTDLGMDIQNISAFLSAKIGEDLSLFDGDDKRFFFSHFILQELCVALHMKLYMSRNEFMSLESELHKSKYQMVTKLMFGLCNTETLSILKQLHFLACREKLILPENVESSSTNQLKKLVIEQLKKLSRGTTEKNVFNDFQICSWVYEMRDDSFAKEVVHSLQKKLVVTGEILPNDVPSFYYLLRHRETALTLSVVAPSFVEEALKRFFIEMEKVFQETNIRVCFS